MHLSKNNCNFIGDEKRSPSYPEIKCIDLSFLSLPETMKTRDKNYRAALIKKGRDSAEHLKRCQEVDLAFIQEHLREFYKNRENCSTTLEEQDLLNKMH